MDGWTGLCVFIFIFHVIEYAVKRLLCVFTFRVFLLGSGSNRMSRFSTCSFCFSSVMSGRGTKQRWDSPKTQTPKHTRTDSFPPCLWKSNEMPQDGWCRDRGAISFVSLCLRSRHLSPTSSPSLHQWAINHVIVLSKYVLLKWMIVTPLLWQRT